MGETKQLGTMAVAVGTLAAVVLVAMAIVTGYQDSGALGNCTTTEANGSPLSTRTLPSACSTGTLFVNGLAIFGTFAAVVVLAIVGKLIIALFKSGND